MENIIEQMEKHTISTDNNKVLYYSVSFDYNDIIKIIRSTITELDIFTKTIDSFDLFELSDNFSLSDTMKNAVCSKYSTHIDKLKTSENFIIHDNILYTANNEFHITTLFTGGKIHEKSADLESQVGKKVLIKVNKLGISEKFITLGIESIKFTVNSEDILYYGNDIKHITVALNKTGKKIFPKDSYTALSNGKLFDIDQTVYGITSKVTQ